MIEYTPILAATIPTAITGVFAYMLGRRKNIMAEKIAKSKTDAEIQGKALDIVKGVIQDMKDEFLREIKSLKLEIEKLSAENAKLKVNRAFEFAEKSPFPESTTAYENLYA